MSRVFARTGLGRMSSGEYQANLNGMNMFFGAVLGFVLSGTEKLSAWQFGVLLTALASVVITVLYISSSKHRLMYSLLALFYAATFPEVMSMLLRGPDLVPDKVRPTLLVWIGMTVMVEFWAREKSQEKSQEKSEDEGEATDKTAVDTPAREPETQR
ncbi:hypothetical protein [Roseateles sp.]|uniref:hypothetical protein n=1 Tax=Roseateles sp. TaxID=1971397 RepID=UPI002F424B1D